MEALNRQALRILKLFGKTDVKYVHTSVGPEQEYFLITKEMFDRRPDLKYTGRTLFGAKPPKGQEMDDHYFGVIKPKVQEFMNDLNEELWKLGILAKTEHNEVAPGQHELAPIYTSTNLATDQNQLMMEMMQKVAARHGLVCLLHEKPFAGVNGSGKHNNWSLNTDDGINLIDPGDTPNENIQFLLVLACILKAIDTHADLLRLSAACPGNDLRLGGSEAPPAIISVFLGEQLEDVVRQLVETGEANKLKAGGKLKTGVSTLPDFEKDATDRNRTSPFAFTGNKFEFRSVGSSDSIGNANTTLNTIVAQAFSEAADYLEKADDFNTAVHDLIKKYLKEHERIIFSGDGYSEKWVEEAKRRGLPNAKTMVEAIGALTTEKAVELYEKFGIFTKAELESRSEVMYETYAKTINIEAHAMTGMSSKQIIPAVMEYENMLAQTVNQMKAAGVKPEIPLKMLKQINDELTRMQNALERMKEERKKGISIKVQKERAFYFKDNVVPAMVSLRESADKLEKIVDKQYWPFPTYADLMFEV
jgi:glutamine synthetase